MTHIEKRLHISAPIEQVWAALTDPAFIGGWMDDDSVEVDLKIGGHYQFFGGETTGVFTQIATPNVLDYTWRQSAWETTWSDSLVRWELQSDGSGTQIRLVHNQFPNDEEQNSHDEGWDIYWLEPMRQWLESQ